MQSLLWPSTSASSREGTKQGIGSLVLALSSRKHTGPSLAGSRVGGTPVLCEQACGAPARPPGEAGLGSVSLRRGGSPAAVQCLSGEEIRLRGAAGGPGEECGGSSKTPGAEIITALAG